MPLFRKKKAERQDSADPSSQKASALVANLETIQLSALLDTDQRGEDLLEAAGRYARVHEELEPVAQRLDSATSVATARAFFQTLEVSEPMECPTPRDVFRSLVSLSATGATSVMGWTGLAESLGPGRNVLLVLVEHPTIPAMLVCCRLPSSGYLAYYANASLADKIGLPRPERWLRSPPSEARVGEDVKTVIIGKQEWMAENLAIPVENSWVRPDDPDGKRVGRYYTWGAAKEACPQGWHLPSDAEWGELVDDLGGEENAGARLKEGGSSGFEAQLRGNRTSDGSLESEGRLANFWTSTEDDDDPEFAWCRFVNNQGSRVGHTTAYKKAGYAVRCVRNG